MATMRYKPSDLPDLLTRLYHHLEKSEYLFYPTSNLDPKLKNDLTQIRHAWKQCWEEAGELLRCPPTAAGRATGPSQRLSIAEQTDMLLSSFSEKDRQKLEKEMQRDVDVQRENQHLQANNEMLQSRIKELSESLSQMMGTRMSSDDRNFENINDPCRPLALSEEYRNFCAKYWLDAKNELDKMKNAEFKERSKCIFLSRLLEVASESAVTHLESMYAGLCGSPGLVSYAPLVGEHKLPQAPHTNLRDIAEIPDEVKLTVTKFLKLRVDKIETSQWKKMVFEKVSEEMKLASNMSQALKKSEILNKYVTSGCQLAWKMAIQLPPMRFRCEAMEKEFDPNKQELAVNSVAPAKNTAVDYYVNPAMLHYRDVVVKGRVVLKPAKYK